MNYYQRRQRKVSSEINVVPYVDVLFVLLVIFMVTAPIISQGVKVELPQGSAKALPDDSKVPLVATVDENGLYYLDTGDGRTQNEVLSSDDLQALVMAHLQLNPQVPVVVRGDKNVRYEQVINLMVLLQNAGVPSVGLMTQPEQG